MTQKFPATLLPLIPLRHYGVAAGLCARMRNKLRNPRPTSLALAVARCGASINYTPMRGRVCYRRLEKSSALGRHSSEFQYGRRSDRRDAFLQRRVIGSTGIYACFTRYRRCSGRVYIASVLDTALSPRALYRRRRRSPIRYYTLGGGAADRIVGSRGESVYFTVKHRLTCAQIKMQMRLLRNHGDIGHEGARCSFTVTARFQFESRAVTRL